MTTELPEVYCANHCSWVGMEADLISDDAGGDPHCPDCGSNSAIMEIPEDWEDLMECVSSVNRWRKMGREEYEDDYEEANRGN